MNRFNGPFKRIEGPTLPHRAWGTLKGDGRWRPTVSCGAKIVVSQNPTFASNVVRVSADETESARAPIGSALVAIDAVTARMELRDIGA